MKYFVVMTSKRQLYPMYGVEKKLGEFSSQLSVVFVWSLIFCWENNLILLSYLTCLAPSLTVNDLLITRPGWGWRCFTVLVWWSCVCVAEKPMISNGCFCMYWWDLEEKMCNVMMNNMRMNKGSFIRFKKLEKFYFIFSIFDFWIYFNYSIYILQFNLNWK